MVYIYLKLESVIMLHGRTPEAFPLKTGTRLRYQASLLLLNTAVVVLAEKFRKKKDV